MMLSVIAQQVTARVRVAHEHTAGAQKPIANHVQVDGGARWPMQQDNVRCECAHVNRNNKTRVNQCK